MASSGTPQKPMIVDLPTPTKPRPEPTPSAGQRQGEAHLAWDNAHPTVPKGNKITNVQDRR